MKRMPGYFPVLIAGLILLLLLNCYLFRQNHIYKSANRQLILQNDSLMSVTIELKRQISSSLQIGAYEANKTRAE